jgi:uncharacterized protein (DUF1800 family)
LTLPDPGWAEPEKVTHLLDRAAFGPSPSDRDRIARVGLLRWLEGQLSPGRDEAMEQRLSGFSALHLSAPETVRRYAPLKQRLKALGVDEHDPEALARAKAELKDDGDALPKQVLIELTQAKLLRAAGSERQLEEVLVDFWFNHFNVSAEKSRDKWLVASFERDAIRPYVFGRFRDLLGATAKHPAMLWYLDNWSSTRDGFVRPGHRGAGEEDAEARAGLNENYARELMELHTVGVDAGYTQADVREAARALTGWTVELRPKQKAFATFVFWPQAHDEGEKQIFGLQVPAHGGQADGERLLDFLARHPATARHLALKLCQKFVSDEPPPELVAQVARTYLATDGDLSALYRVIFSSKAFWSDAARGAKTKTPLEFVVSAVRAVGRFDEVQRPVAQALERLGMPLYRCAPPTGYAETFAAWVSAGALISRINAGLALARGQVPGVLLELPPPGRTPEATVDAFAQRILGGPLSADTRATVLRALGRRPDDGVDDDEARPVDTRLLTGLLLGSPEFQKQ